MTSRNQLIEIYDSSEIGEQTGAREWPFVDVAGNPEDVFEVRTLAPAQRGDTEIQVSVYPEDGEIPVPPGGVGLSLAASSRIAIGGRNYTTKDDVVWQLPKIVGAATPIWDPENFMGLGAAGQVLEGDIYTFIITIDDGEMNSVRNLGLVKQNPDSYVVQNGPFEGNDKPSDAVLSQCLKATFDKRLDRATIKPIYDDGASYFSDAQMIFDETHELYSKQQAGQLILYDKELPDFFFGIRLSDSQQFVSPGIEDRRKGALHYFYSDRDNVTLGHAQGYDHPIPVAEERAPILFKALIERDSVEVLWIDPKNRDHYYYTNKVIAVARFEVVPDYVNKATRKFEEARQQRYVFGTDERRQNPFVNSKQINYAAGDFWPGAEWNRPLIRINSNNRTADDLLLGAELKALEYVQTPAGNLVNNSFPGVQPRFQEERPIHLSDLETLTIDAKLAFDEFLESLQAYEGNPRLVAVPVGSSELANRATAPVAEDVNRKVKNIESPEPFAVPRQTASSLFGDFLVRHIVYTNLDDTSFEMFTIDPWGAPFFTRIQRNGRNREVFFANDMLWNLSDFEVGREWEAPSIEFEGAVDFDESVDGEAIVIPEPGQSVSFGTGKEFAIFPRFKHVFGNPTGVFEDIRIPHALALAPELENPEPVMRTITLASPLAQNIAAGTPVSLIERLSVPNEEADRAWAAFVEEDSKVVAVAGTTRGRHVLTRVKIDTLTLRVANETPGVEIGKYVRTDDGVIWRIVSITRERNRARLDISLERRVPEQSILNPYGENPVLLGESNSRRANARRGRGET